MSTTSSPENAVAIRVGDVLADKYRVERKLGIGGMGIVVAARHLQLGQLVALKFLLPTAMTDPVVVARFLREARAAVSLRSEHVARVFDVGTLARPGGDVPYIVMEYLDGCDLRSLVKRGPVKVEEAVTYVAQACEAIQEAHELGIIHRDIKPENLFVAKRTNGLPLIKVLDFGISKVAASEGEMQLTGTADAIGTPYYMSPEQMRSMQSVTPRSDVWSMGAVLYELLAGKRPFVGQNVTEICSGVLTSEPAPLTGVDPGLVSVVLRCLQKDPLRRFESMAEFAAALAPFAKERVGATAMSVSGAVPEMTLIPHSQTVPFRQPMASQDTGSPLMSTTDRSTGSLGGTSVSGGQLARSRAGLQYVAAIAVLLALASLVIAVWVVFVRANDAPSGVHAAPSSSAIHGEKTVDTSMSAAGVVDSGAPNDDAGVAPEQSVSAAPMKAPLGKGTPVRSSASPAPASSVARPVVVATATPKESDTERVRK